jgi:hypothetical protein
MLVPFAGLWNAALPRSLRPCALIPLVVLVLSPLFPVILMTLTLT